MSTSRGSLGTGLCSSSLHSSACKFTQLSLAVCARACSSSPSVSATSHPISLGQTNTVFNWSMGPPLWGDGRKGNSRTTGCGARWHLWDQELGGSSKCHFTSEEKETLDQQAALYATTMCSLRTEKGMYVYVVQTLPLWIDAFMVTVHIWIHDYNHLQ